MIHPPCEHGGPTSDRWCALRSWIAVSLLACQAWSQAPGASGGALIPEEACYDVRHYDLALKVDPSHKAIEGRLAMRARLVAEADRLALDLDGRLAVTAVESRGRALDYDRRDGRIWITLPEPVPAGEEIEVAVTYGGVPREAPRPPWDGGFTWKRSKDGHPWIATTCQGEGADLWWPCKDQPSDKPETMDLHITVPEDLFCASNGTLRSDVRNGDGTRTLHWHIANPISNYCVALNIGHYEVVEATYESVTGEKVPAYLWVLPEDLEKARRALPEFLQHLRFFEEVCGPYPFRNEKYGVVETPHLGMEHQTCIAYGNHFRLTPDGYDWLHHHELSHEWWGNLVTCRDWKDMWVHEGFGTYMQALYIERLRGPEAYRAHMRSTRRGLLNQRPVAPRETRDSKQIYFLPNGAYDNDIYDKGSWILHTLRWTLGDRVFFEFLRRAAYPDPAMEKVTDGSQERFVDTEDIRAVAEKVSGRDLSWFFEVYLRQPALPELRAERKGDELELRWIAPRDLPFPMPVPLRVGGEVRRIEMPKGAATVKLPHGEECEVDPDSWLLKK